MSIPLLAAAMSTRCASTAPEGEMTDYVSPLVFLSREYLLAMGTVPP
jgi:hypothetical protein